MQSDPNPPRKAAVKRKINPVTGYGSGPVRILATAERLFGQRGIEGVSLREIAVAAGQANNSAVALHFQNREGLLRAIVETRLPEIDDLRARRLAKARRSGVVTLKMLVECLLMAWVDDVDDSGEHTYACFMARLQYYGEEFHPLVSRRELAPATAEILAEIKERLTHLSPVQIHLRIRLLVSMFLGALLHHGNIGFGKDEAIAEHELFQTLIDLTVAGFEAPESGR